MRIKKIMRQYYKNKLEETEEIQPLQIPSEFTSEKHHKKYSIDWSNVFAYALIVCCILHFLLTEKWLMSGRFLLQ